MKNVSLTYKIVGIFSIIGFIISGLYMRYNIANIELEDEYSHILFRANHIYILLVSLVCLIIGFSNSLNKIIKFKGVSYVSNLLILLSVIILNIAFYIEPVKRSLDRPITANALFLFLAGVVFLLISFQINCKKQINE